MALASEEGRSERGRRVFFSRQAQCSTCHRIAGWGGDFGPNLTNVGLSKSREQIARAILQPSEEIAPEWQGWFVKTSDGQTHVGRQIDVGTNNVELLLVSGEFENYKEVESYGMAAASLMPEGLYHHLSAEDFRDLVTYLASTP
jgi:putative heme-binding domain-containing protein